MYDFPAIVDRYDSRLQSNLILRDRGIRLTWIPKNMCSTLKLSFGLASGVIAAELERGFVDHPEWIHASMVPLEPHHHRDFDWPVSAAVIREPAGRLMSTIVEKGVYEAPGDFERVFAERLRNYSHYIHRPLEEQTFADVLGAIRYFPDRFWDMHMQAQVGFLSGRYTHLLRLEDNPAHFFERHGVRIVTVDHHSIRKVPGEARIVDAGERLVDLRHEMAGQRRPIRFSPELAEMLQATTRDRFAADLELWRSLS